VIEYTILYMYCLLLNHKNKPYLRKRHQKTQKRSRHDYVGKKTFLHWIENSYLINVYNIKYNFKQTMLKRVCFKFFLKLHRTWTLLCVYSTNCVSFTFPYSPLIIYNWNIFVISVIWRNVTSKSFKFDISKKNLYEEVWWKCTIVIFITLLLIIMLELKRVSEGVGSFLSVKDDCGLLSLLKCRAS